MKTIHDLEPKNVFENFYSLTQIPHPSKKEAKMIAFLKEFGENLGLETIVDKVGNVIIRKPATPGFEDRMGVVLQAHIDMVPQKNEDTKHDFEKDPIETYVEEGWLKAKGTTLGADNGVGVAAAMAVLQAADIEHGPIEVLLTVDEETGMTGANELEPGLLKGDILLNLDSEDEGELYVGCAGGVDTTAEFAVLKENVPTNYAAYRIAIKGLKGGHSGIDIILGRANANKLMNTLLLMAAEKYGLRLSDINGGSLRNAIPRESFATVVLATEKEEVFNAFVAEYTTIVKEEFGAIEPDFQLVLTKSELPKEMLSAKSQDALYEAIAKCPNGVIAMSADFEGVVETSSNLAIVKSEGDKIQMASLQRSSVDASKEKLAAQIRKVFADAGATSESSGDYPGWKPNINSPILKTMKEVYNNKYGRVPKIMVIHAGLECGILGAKYPNWDMISFGPTLRHPHSPDEKLKIDTVQLFWDFLVETLKFIPVKE